MSAGACVKASFKLSLTLQTLDKHSAAIGSSEQLCKALKMKVIDVHNAADGHKKTGFQIEFPQSNSGMAL